MTNQLPLQTTPTIVTLGDLAKLADYSLMDTLNCDPDARENGVDHSPRQVFTGHYVPVKPTPIQDPEYVTHSKTFFRELGFSDSMAQSADFVRLFSGDLTEVPAPLRKVGWATGYALSIYGSEYYQQCPFQTGNGYGDGRAMSVLEAVINGQRWEMQLKGGGRTPYCRGADGRAVLRSSVREFLAQEHMHALGVASSRSLSLYVSKTEQVNRPWYAEGSRSQDPDRLISEAVAISTRVAPSFIRVGQLELFSRRVHKQEHPQAMAELEVIVLHLIDREYSDIIDNILSMAEKVVLLARAFRNRLTSLVANWIRVGYCQGNFNSDNCAAGGFTLDYGPFGFCDVFNPQYQPWTGGGHHFSFMNQPVAAERNFNMFCKALQPLVASHQDAIKNLDEIRTGFTTVMQEKMEKMWAEKLGLHTFNAELLRELETLMAQTAVDYTIFFRELSTVPSDIGPLKKSFYKNATYNADPEGMDNRWSAWLTTWKSLNANSTDPSTTEVNSARSPVELSRQMKLVNPKYNLREWFVVPAYQQASIGNYSLVRELQEVMTQPYAEQSIDMEEKYYRLKPLEFFETGGLSHYSCSS
ncbi:MULTISPECIES: protein adenylyltransferase SelO [unclassified Colwellia]|uniref:protein adenylyltransferase SelO n=1 Tax=unclassified Colwellia TaxID=196834 RepID=UPI0015F5C9BB|nr:MULTISPECIES: protein adenylyltransferase SelO family protein [unclassified Colwellia]MBA6232750.1 YdiU family protein [Colwellia sp. MB02u-7]MBA6236162.1 YdiU family protein [Colwellia sp. MB02u-11]MBA6256586.1 YdiU family protein [Colwellia sp. MB3u-28]MBA6261301.1 YdiU family protein [Colwellia sp. MB3u-41]MBA6298438.1 YdiU family protein [Colwellia sp. MB3u-22]